MSGDSREPEITGSDGALPGWLTEAIEAPPKPGAERPFYFEDSQVVLQVEEQKYKIHRYFLTRESVFFDDLFSLPQPGDSTIVEGSDDNPIKMPETHTLEIENLLRFFYFGMHDDYTPSLTDWIAMLSISTRFIFEKVRERAIKEITARLDEVEPFELIQLAIKYDVEQWVKPAYRRIVIRSSPITHTEALKVPFHMAVMLMRSREKYWKNDGVSGVSGSPMQPAVAAGGGAFGGFGNSTSKSNSNHNTRASADLIIDQEIKLMESGPKVPSKSKSKKARARARHLAASTASAAADSEVLD
ncbi:hypothetical protein BJV74DRAFT_833458 [Russula compacta]|nr:hypothetical protein BJV74DRAFT_833458 [Russula compacta]